MFKVNFHVTEKCNYRCGYCFADFDSKGKILSFDDAKMIKVYGKSMNFS